MTRLGRILRHRVVPAILAWPVRVSRYAGQESFMRTYVWYLRKMGVVFKGMPRYISPLCRIDTHGTCEIGDKVVISDNVVLLTHDYSLTVGLNRAHLIRAQEEKAIVSGIRIGDNSFIGWNATVLPGSQIGNDVIVGAGAVVRGCIPDGSLVIGNPAQCVGRSDEWAKRRLARNGGRDVMDKKDLARTMPSIIRMLR